MLGRTDEWNATDLDIGIPSHFVSLKDEHIQQSRLSVVQMANDCNISDKLWERGHIEEKCLIKSCLWHVFLLHDPFPGLDRSDDRLRKRLCVFLLDESLDILAIHVGRRWVILFVFVEDYSVVDGFCYRRGVISATGWTPRVEWEAVKRLKRVGKRFLLIREG